MARVGDPQVGQRPAQEMELGRGRSGHNEALLPNTARASPAAESAAACYCMVKTRCCPCCCCVLPRWAWCSMCSIIAYFVILPGVLVIGHFAVYPGAPLSSPHTLRIEECNETAIPNDLQRTLVAMKCHVGAKSGPREPAILFGGNGMNMYDTMEVMSRMLPLNKSWEVYSMSMAGLQYGLQGATPSDATSWADQETALQDIRALLAHVSKSGHGRPITVFGWSLGSAMAAGLASMSTGSDEVSCLVLGNPFTSLRSEVLFKTKWTMLPWLYLFDEWPTQFWVESLSGIPTVVLSSTEDEMIPESMHRHVYEASPSSNKWLVEKKTSHMDVFKFQSDLRDILALGCIDSPSQHVGQLEWQQDDRSVER